ncbi:MAG: DUF87 domain-containing protein, partial [Candidatus Thermoplasmatota archaeon]
MQVGMSGDRLHIGTFDGNPFQVEPERLVTARTAVIGMSGSGKSNLIGVMCEEMCRAGLPFVIIDPEGEYCTLKEAHEIVWACNDRRADVPLSIEGCRALADGVVTHRGRLIFDTSESSNEFDLVSEFLRHFYEAENRARTPILLIVEEADRFAPQSSGQDVKWLHEISRRGRKRGIGLLVATQRPAMLDKNVLSQCGNQFIGRLRTENDLKAVALFFHSSQMLRSLPNLECGQFHVMGDISRVPHLVQIRKRETAHKGRTPEHSEASRFTASEFVSALFPHPREVPAVPEAEQPVEVAGEQRPQSASEAVQPIEAPDVQTGGVVGFNVGMDDALTIANRELKKNIFTGAAVESIEECTAAYWPMLTCRLETAR